MVCAIVAEKLCIPVAHVEAGIRSGDWSMPEEINRMVTDYVDNGGAFANLLAAVGEATRGMPVVFPVHPRTAKTLQGMASLPTNLLLVEPQPYLEFNYLVKHAKVVITDSGGITEETTVMGVPCLTLRDSTERPETVTIGTNELIGTDPAKLKPALDRQFAGAWQKGEIPEKWDGQTGTRIVAALEQLLTPAERGA